MNEKEIENRILGYLLGECDEEEAFEVEKLCRENSSWQSQKISLGQVIGLVEDSLSSEAEFSHADKGEQLSIKQRSEIKSLLEKKKSEQNTLDKEEKDMSKQTPPKNLKLIYWAPLAAALVAALVAYFGNPKKESEGKAEATNTSTSEVEDKTLEKAADQNSSVTPPAKFKASDILPAKTELALQESINASANQALSSRTSETIEELEQQTIEQLPDGKELIKRIIDSDAGFADSSTVSQLVQEEAPKTSLADAFSSPSFPKDSVANPPTNRSVPIPEEGSGKEMTNDEKSFSSTALSIAQRKINWKSVLQSPEVSFIFNEKGDSLGKILSLAGSSGNEIRFKRANWPNQNRSFKLTPGVYEIRLSNKSSETLIVKGTVSTLPSGENYQFRISQAWQLDPEEKRKSIPLNELLP